MALPKKDAGAKTQKNEKAGKTETMKKTPAVKKQDTPKPAAKSKK